MGEVYRVAGGEVIQAESGSVSGAASIVSQYVDLNNDDTAHGRAFVSLNDVGGRLTLANVEGGPGGQGAIEIRYSRGYGPVDIEVIVNGNSHFLTLEQTGNEPGWRHTKWLHARIENIALNAGSVNTIAITTAQMYPDLSLDDIVITTAAERAAAQPHRRVLNLSATDRQALNAYLLQLDDQPGAEPMIFEDGFETGNMNAWSN